MNNLRPMRIWQSLLFTAVPASLVYVAQWAIAPAISSGLHQPFLVGYLICWGATQIGFFVAALVAYKLEGNPAHWTAFARRYRLRRPSKSDVAWAFVTLGVMLITFLGLSFTSRWLASIPAFSPHPAFPPELAPDVQANLVPGVFMGMRLRGAWWVLLAYVAGWVLNILGEEMWYRGFMLPRQELAHGRLGWLVNGLSFTLLHVVWKWNLIAYVPGSLFLSYVVQRQKNTWVGMITHGILNFSPIIAIAMGVIG